MKQDKYSTRYVLKRLLTDHINPYRHKIYLAVFFMSIVAVSSASIVNYVQPAIDKVFINQDQTMLYVLPMWILGISIIKGIAEFAQNYLVKSVGQRVLSDLQVTLYEHLLNADIAFINHNSSARLISRFTNDISLMRSAVSNLLVGVAKHLLTVVLLIFLMISLQPGLGLVIFCVFPIAIYPIQRNGRRMKSLSYSAQQELGNYTARLDETFESIKVVKSYMAEKFESERAKSFIENIYQLYIKTTKYDALTSPIMETLSGIAMAIIIIYGGHKVASGELSVGAIFEFITAFVSAYRPYKSLVSFNVNLQEGVAAATRLFKVLDQKPEIQDKTSSIDLEFKDGDIEFKNATLEFSGVKVVDSLNLHIKNNSTIALVGKSGEGKTSIANLLLRFYNLNSGSLTISGVEISDIKLACLRSQISLVTQDTMLFDASVAQNIAYNSNANMAEIISAAKAASAHDFIIKLEDGYDTIIGHQGNILSGGQRQRIAIARAFVKNAPIIILDEATSSLDSETEQEIKSSISELCKNRTTIIITHRLATIEHADMIHVVHKGRIVESGTHEELLQLRGQYANLYKHFIIKKNLS
ncbi:MAG: ABC transporter transmembrane domain-containing protein [Rickettsiaceae bacterium]|nr:ABC transporter transmembrane domain-containing protein [Rickettsiaceae bacterium]